MKEEAYGPSLGLILVGAILICVSSYPAFLHSRELLLADQAKQQFQLRRLDILVDEPFLWKNQLILVPRTSLGAQCISIKVGSQEFTLTHQLPLEEEEKDVFLRHHRQLALLELADAERNTCELVIVTRSGEGFPGETDKLEYGLIVLGADGALRRENFRYADRGNPVYRKILAEVVTSFAIGFHCDDLTAWPSLWYPIVYPWGFIIVGVLLLTWGGIGAIVRITSRSTAIGTQGALSQHDREREREHGN